MKQKDKHTENQLVQFINWLNKSKEEQIVNEASLNIQRIREVDVDKAFSAVDQRIFRSKNKTRLLVRLQRVAAVLFLPLLAMSVYLFVGSPDHSRHTVSRTIENPTSIRSQLELPDGSRVWLNSASSITYNEPFNKRSISLKGEAFFDVMKQNGAPFSVETGKISVEVLGTRFNVMAYPEDKNIEVVLEEGSVSILNQEEKGAREIRMKPNNRYVFNMNTETASIYTEDIEKYIAWHKGRLVFDDTPLDELAHDLERWYGIDVTIRSDEINQFRITTTFENESIHTVMELLELSSPIKIDYEPAQRLENGVIDSKGHLIIDKE